MPASHYYVLTGGISFMLPNQQCQSSESIHHKTFKNSKQAIYTGWHPKTKDIVFDVWLPTSLCYTGNGNENNGNGNENRINRYVTRTKHNSSLQKLCKLLHTHIHKHTTVLRPSWTLYGTTQVSWYQKGKTRKVKPTWIYWSKR